ncbi:hypothetical protein ONE63_009327 [Megalurothrips usitatus]|uniref:Branched-chain-amino-acid aminotransferase n=1 Tax=Megalurothrips usitatus TaxID=439358 RepID=A0AAV7XJ93_9NEOP|nr:hypothetical protein ONE63_009327 [Megalurothrips usitatus]
MLIKCIFPPSFVQFVSHQFRCIHSEERKWQSVAAATAAAATTACAAAQENLQPMNTFKYSDTIVRLAEPHQLHPKPDAAGLQFGKLFTDHMLKIEYHKRLGGWQKPVILPFENIVLHPAAKVLHYAVELFEGMKAYRGVDGQIRLFRPDMNMERMNRSAVRAGLPPFSGPELIKCLSRLVSVDQEWVPHSESSSLYIRPTLIGIDPSLGIACTESALLYAILSPVGAYFSSGFQPVTLMADPQYTRAFPGGCGDRKMGSNYAPTIHVQREAMQRGFQQVLWLYGPDEQLTEVGTMNIFLYFINDNGERELVTPNLDGLILPGVTRMSILELTRGWNEFKVTERKITMSEVIRLQNENRLLEMFGAGTACIVSPVASIHYKNLVIKFPMEEQENPIYRRLERALTSIQYGRVDHPWAVAIS